MNPILHADAGCAVCQTWLRAVEIPVSAALGIEAGTGETTEIGSTAKRRKPDPKGNAQNQSGDSNARQ